MAQQNNDDVARALAALAGGAVPSEHETPSGGIPSESTIFEPSPVTPAPAKPTGEVPLFAPNAIPAGTLTPARTTRPATVAVRPAVNSAATTPNVASIVTDKPVKSRTLAAPAASPAPSITPAPAAPPAAPPMPVLPPVATVRQSSSSKRPVAPMRPSAPVPRSTATSAPSLQPSTTPSTSQTAHDAATSQAIEDVVPSGDLLSEITEDDDVIAPAPDLSAFTPKVRPVVSKTHLYEQTNFRRTIIPVLLTGGVLLIVLGAWSQLDRAGMLGGLGTGIGILFIALGVALLAVGVLNMLHVKHILESTALAK